MKVKRDVVGFVVFCFRFLIVKCWVLYWSIQRESKATMRSLPRETRRFRMREHAETPILVYPFALLCTDTTVLNVWMWCTARYQRDRGYTSCKSTRFLTENEGNLETKSSTPIFSPSSHITLSLSYHSAMLPLSFMLLLRECCWSESVRSDKPQLFSLAELRSEWSVHEWVWPSNRFHPS